MSIVIKVSPECVPGLASPQQLPVGVGAGGLQAGVQLVVVNTGCNRAPVLRGGSYGGLHRSGKKEGNGRETQAKKN